MRPMSLRARQALTAEQTDEVFLALLTIDHPSFAEPYRFVNDGQELTSRGAVYHPYPFDAVLPPDTDEELGGVQITIDNVDRDIVLALRQLDSRPTVVLEVVMASQPDVVEAGPFEFELVEAPWNHITVTGNLAYEPILDEPFPADTYTPNNFPALF